MKDKWVEVSVLVEQELAEAVASTLSGIINGGIVQERTFANTNRMESGGEIGPVRVYGYLSVDSDLEENQERIKRALYYLGKISPLPEPTFTFLDDQDWATAWQDRYHPIPLGRDLIIVPTWLKNPSPERTPIFIDPSLAFGSGTHPSTQLALILMENFLVDHQIEQLIDVGCGSGILSIAGAKMGVPNVMGLDIDPDAVRISRKNAVYNKVEENIRFLPGSVKQLLNGDAGIYQAPLVIANIIAPVLIKLFEDGLVKLVTVDGFLVLSGILEEQLPEILSLMKDHGIDHQNTLQHGEWTAVIGNKKKD